MSVSTRWTAATMLAAALVAMPAFGGPLPLSPPGAPAPAQYNLPDLTGVWHGDDGGTYYIRMIRNEVYWLGERAPVNSPWVNIASGRIEGDGAIHLRWVDVPKGGTSSGGHLVLQIVSPSQLQAVSKSGGFGGSNWSR
jgi:hypothetical protein